MKRNAAIDILRLVFAVIIMLHHSRYVMGYENCVFAGGSLAVEFFFIVSGYLMAKSAVSARRAGTASFLYRKFCAVIPEFWTGWLIGFVLLMVFGHVSVSGTLEKYREYIFEPILLRMSGIYTGGFNGASWYVSSMLICMAILYPLTKRFPEAMQKVAAPLIAVLLFGYLCQNFDHPRDPSKWIGFTYKGNIRAMADLCLGIAGYGIAEKMRGVCGISSSGSDAGAGGFSDACSGNGAGSCGSASGNRLKPLGRVLVSLAEVLIYASFIRYMYLELPGQSDYFYILLIWIGVILTFSGLGLEAGIKGGKLCDLAASYSTALFFGHLYIATQLGKVLPETMDGSRKLLYYVVISLANGILICMLSSLERRCFPYVKERMKGLFLEEA